MQRFKNIHILFGNDRVNEEVRETVKKAVSRSECLNCAFFLMSQFWCKHALSFPRNLNHNDIQYKTWTSMQCICAYFHFIR